LRRHLLICAILLAGAATPQAQQINPAIPPPPPLPEAPVEQPEPPPEQPVFDPLHAEKSMEVGTFYLKKGNYDAAIDRFIDVTHFQPKLAKPWKFLGEAYEKKHANTNALDAYRKYLELLPNAEDAEKIKKRIAALEEKNAQQAAKHLAIIAK